jgi:hypothetical protein
METSSRPPFRINIKRGKKLSETNDINSYLTNNDKISPLLPTIRRNAKLQKECAVILSSIFANCEVLQLSEEQLTLSTPNAAIASKLKQQLPKLQTQLQQRGWQINAIRIKVQVKTMVEKPLPTKQLVLSGPAISAFGQLGNTLEDTPQNEGLKAALKRLVMRHQPQKV